MIFKDEAVFEEAVIKLLKEKGWSHGVLRYKNEKDLIQNWADILYQNNQGITRLNGCPLTEGEMQQVLEQVNAARTPLKLNGLINGKTILIKRDNPDDQENFGKEVSLKIYDRLEIAAGSSRYQIVQQPIFKGVKEEDRKNRGDLLLLINGMPVIHIELKKDKSLLGEAQKQIKRYSRQNVFTGLFSLVQVFVTMTPEKTTYFANPGPDGQFNPDYFFQWADFNNEPINEWNKVTQSLLSIPMAHQLIGFYTIADQSDGMLKVMRSYQYHAVNAITGTVRKNREKIHRKRGGYIWHTTGSGKTMTSFKAAQLIAGSKDADKVIFLTDRIELGTQSLEEYKSFAEETESVQATEDTHVLVNKLKSPDPSNTMIVTSIQKMSRIHEEDGGLNAYDIELINRKSLVFIVDEAHRSTFGEMMSTIKATFPEAVFFGFTGTPIHEENQKKKSTTATVFGNELHRYSLADGIRDKNVLGFDPYKVMTFKDLDLRKAVALKEAKAADLDEVFADKKKEKVFNRFMDSSQVKMAGEKDEREKWIKGIEDYVPNSQYEGDEHRKMVVRDIQEQWPFLSKNGKFSAILATSSILEAIAYYRLIRSEMPDLKVTCLFEPSIDNNTVTLDDTVPGPDKQEEKEEAIREILSDYNRLYSKNYRPQTYARFKKDLSLRLARKGQYKNVPEEGRLDLLIVVDQMLTGFDSKWINTLYLDKILEYEKLIQAFSRTNRLCDRHLKPHGTIRYYRKPHTMERNIEAAVKAYSGDKPLGLFVEKLPENLKKMNEVFGKIQDLFKSAGVPDFDKLPKEREMKGKFAVLFKELNTYLDGAKVQGFRWDQLTYEFPDESGQIQETVTLEFGKEIFQALTQRYKELAELPGSVGPGEGEIPFDIDGYLTENDPGMIDADYMNSRFNKFLKLLRGENISEEEVNQALTELYQTFPALSQEDQKYATLFLHDVESGEANLEAGKTFRDYIAEYRNQAQNDRIHELTCALGLNEQLLRDLMSLHPTEDNINDHNRLGHLKETVNTQMAKEYFEKLEGTTLSKFKVNIKVDDLLRKFILSQGKEFIA